MSPYWVFHRWFRERLSITSAGQGGLNKDADNDNADTFWGVGGWDSNTDVILEQVCTKK